MEKFKVAKYQVIKKVSPYFSFILHCNYECNIRSTFLNLFYLLLFFVFQTKFHIVASTVCTFHSSMLYCVQIVTGNALFRKKTSLFTIQVGVLLTVRATCVTRRGTSRMKNKAKSITEHRHLCVIHCFCSKRQYRRNYGKLNSASHVSYVEYARASKKTELIIHTSANNP